MSGGPDDVPATKPGSTAPDSTAPGPAAPGRGRAGWSRPAASIPLPVLRAIPVVLACCAFALLPVPYAVIALVLAVLGALLPATLATWGVALVIALVPLMHPAAPADVRPYLVLALVHALHVLGGLNLALPALGRMHLRVLARPARRYLVVQVVAQPVLFAGLVLAQEPVRDALPPAAVVLATAACAVAVVVVLRVLAARR